MTARTCIFVAKKITMHQFNQFYFKIISCNYCIAGNDYLQDLLFCVLVLKFNVSGI